VFLTVVSVSVAEAVPPEVRVTALMLSDCDGALFVGDIVVVRLTVPVKVPMLFRVIVEVAWELRRRDRLAGFADIVKSPPVVKTAVCVFSGSGVGVPFVMVIHVLLTLVGGGQPVWYPIGVPVVAVVTLYIAVKSRPVIGALVICPGAATTATSIVSALSWESQTLPLTSTPPIHSWRIDPPGTTVPVMSAPAGLRIV
jgi:hypothetical protein